MAELKLHAFRTDCTINTTAAICRFRVVYSDTMCFCLRSNPGANVSSTRIFWLTACHDEVPSDGLALRARPT